MTVPPTSSSGIGRNGLSGRDWLILPLLSLLTIASILFAMEKVARLAFPDSGHSINECMVINDPSLGVHARPNSMCTEQLPESGLVEYRFNRCGHRSVMECGPKSKGIYRIVVLGSSAALGVSVARERTFAALLPALLSRDTGRPVEVYDAAVEYQRPAALALQLNRILAEEPADEILWILTPTDIRDASDVAPDQGELRRSGLFAAIRNQAAGVVETRSFSRLQNAMHFLLNRSRAATIIRHYWYLSMSPNRYVDSYLQSGDFESGFLRAQPGAEWQDRIR